jgi:hypothetical protein
VSEIQMLRKRSGAAAGLIAAGWPRWQCYVAALSTRHCRA